jgi:hypothetical protein
MDSISRFGWCAFNKRIRLVRSLWNWAAKPDVGILHPHPFSRLSMLRERPIREFRRQRREERQHGAFSSFNGDEVRALVLAGPEPLRAMTLLGYFCAYGRLDLGELYQPALTVFDQPQRLFIRGRDEVLPAGWGRLIFPRPKTELDRAALIPPFVVQSLQCAIALRPKPAEAAWSDRCFLSSSGTRVCYEVVHTDPAGLIEKVTIVDVVGQKWRRLLERVGMCKNHGWQTRLPFQREELRLCPVCRLALEPMRRRGFNVLRHTATTFAAGSGASDDTRRLFEGHADRENRLRQTFYLDPNQLHDMLLIARDLMARAGFTENEALPAAPTWETLLDATEVASPEEAATP